MLRGNRLWNLGVAEEPGLGPGARRAGRTGVHSPLERWAGPRAGHRTGVAPQWGRKARVRARACAPPPGLSFCGDSAGPPAAPPLCSRPYLGEKATLPWTFTEVAGYSVT